MVLVSHAHKFVFMKTSKTAGTSIEMALEHACAPKGHVAEESTKTRISEYGIIGARLCPPEHPWPWAIGNDRWRNHKTAKSVRSNLGRQRFDSYTKITTVRNPFDRCISIFHWRRKNLAAAAQCFDELRHGFQQFLKNTHWKDDRKNVFIGKKFIIDRAIRFEHMSQDMEKLAADIGISCAPPPHTKTGKATRKNYPVADYYDQTCIDIVRKRSSWVFKHFTYNDHPNSNEVPQ